MRKKLFLKLAALVLILVGCAGQFPLISNQSKRIREPDPRAINLFVDGVILDLIQNIPAALLSYHEALLYDSTSPALYLAIGRDYIKLGNEESALTALKKCIRLNPDELEALELVAKIHFNQGKSSIAERIFKEILNKDSSRIDAYYNLAILYLQRNEVENAVDMYKGILLHQQVLNPQVLLNLGELYIDLGRFEEAAGVYGQLIEMEPRESSGYFGLGLVNEALGDTSDAIKNYIKTLQITPDLHQARDRLCQIHSARKEWNEAIQLYTEAVEKDSTDIVIWLQMSQIYQQADDSINAIKTLREIKQRFPKDWRGYLNLGRLFLNQQKLDSAYNEFKNVIDISEETFWGWLFTGISLVHLDSLDESLYYLKKSLDITPGDPMANYYLGSVLDRLKQSSEAIPYLEKAIEARPDWISALSALAGIYESRKEYEQSDSLFQKALFIDPENALILNNYGYSLSERGIRLEQAMEMAKKALEKDPENGAYLDTMGWIYFKMGEYEKALEYIEKACSLKEKNAVLIDHLGDVYKKLGMNKKAQDAWQKALELDQDNTEILNKLDRKVEE